jgi:hypothetical protein
VSNGPTIASYNCVEVPRARVKEFADQPFSLLWETAETHGFRRIEKTTTTDCKKDHALLRNCTWTARPIVLKEHW